MTEQLNPVTEENWGEVSESLKTTFDWKFLRDGDNRLRLLIPEGRTPKQFYQEVDSYYKGKKGSKFMIFAIVHSLGNDNLSELGITQDQVLPVVIPKTALTGIINILKAGWDVLSDGDAYGVTISRSKATGKTNYLVAQARDQMSINREALTFPEKTIDQIAVDFNKNQLERAKNQAVTEKEAGGLTNSPAPNPQNDQSGW